MKKIVHLQYFIGAQGNAPYRLHSAMLNAGIDSSMMVFNTPRAANKNFHRFSGLNKLIKIYIYGLLHKFIRRKIKNNSNLFSFPYFIGNNVTKHSMIADADIIYLHWINGGFLSLDNIDEILSIGKPVVFYMHDMWTITGGCHHSFECFEYESKCNHCPMFGGEKKNTYASVGMSRKKVVFNVSNLYFISPSKWLQNSAQKSAALIKKDVFCIPNIVDEKVFKKIDKNVARKILNISPELTVISFGCVAGANNSNKGWTFFQSALEIIKFRQPNLDIMVQIFGSEYDKNIVESLIYPVRFLGQVNDETSMVVVNNSADVFVSPSLAESFGMTALENIMCGTPVVVFDNGGTVDFVKHKDNGYLAKYKSSDNLAEGILFCIDNKMPMSLDSDFLSKNIITKHQHLIDHLVSNID